MARSSSDSPTAPPRKPRVSRAFVALVTFVVVAGVIIFCRHAIAGFAISRAVAMVTGVQVRFGTFVLGRAQSAFADVRIATPSGEELFEAGRVTLRYSLHDLVWGGRHRYGLVAVDVAQPVVSLVRHPDGSYNVSSVAVKSNPVGAAGAAASPFALRLRVTDGAIRLIDRAPVSADLGEQRIENIAVDADVASNRRSALRGSAAFIGRRIAGAPLERWPLAVRGFLDVGRGIGLARATAARMPLRGPIGFVQHSRAVHVDAGLLQRLDIQLYALNVGRDESPDVHLGGHADLAHGQLTFGSLREPVRDLHGRLNLLDDSVSATRLSGALAGVPLLARGSAYRRANPTLRLGIAADADLADLREIFAFSKNQPVAGVAHVQTLIEAPVSELLIRTAFQAPHARYTTLPFADLRGRVDYHAGSVVLDAIHARYGAATVAVGGRFLLGGPVVRSEIVAAASGPAASVPYAENLAPEGTVDVLALFTGAGGYRARGAVAVRGGGVAGDGTFAVDERGVGEFGPWVFERSDGSSLVGALRLERPTSRSAAWISARNYRVNVPPAASALPGLTVPGFPPVAGTIDADLVGGGTPAEFALAGSVRGHDLRIATTPLGTGQADIRGSFGDVRLANVRVAGPIGRFAGTAVASGGAFGLRGFYDGALERLVPLTGPQQSHGAVSGPVAALQSDREIVVQSGGARLQRASVRGVLVDAATGTIAVRANAFHLLVGDATIAGRRAVAREAGGRVAISAPDLPSFALSGTGLPLDAGNVSAYGLADLRGKSASFDGTITVASGRARGYGVSGDAQVDLDGPRALVYAATGALGATYGSIGGTIDGIGERGLRYNLDTHVPLGDIELLRADLGLAVRHLEGSFSANLHVRGSGTRPAVDGTIAAPEGRYNGLAFRDAGAAIALDPTGIAAQSGTLTVGSTRTALTASYRTGALALHARSERADLADFNDYFDASDTLAGRGQVDIAFQTASGRTRTRGLVDLRGVRFREFVLGDTRANWSTSGRAIRGDATVASPAGTLVARAAIVPASGSDPIRAFRDATYDVRGSFGKIDLGTWLPAAGFNQPVLGTVDARVTVAGRLPNFAVGVDAGLADASVAGFAVKTGHLRASARGSRITVASSDADLGFVQLSGTGRVGLAAGDPLAFDLRAATPDVGPAFRMFIPAAHDLNVAGALDADVRVSGTFGKPKVEGGFDLSDARYGAFTIPRAIGALALAGNAIELRDADIEFKKGQAFVAGSLPFALVPLSFGPPSAPLSFDVTARGVDLAQFAPLLPAGTQLGGTVEGRFGVEGTVARPRLLGSVSISQGSYRSAFERAPIQHVDARLAFAGTSIALQAFHADVGSGTLDAGGRVDLPFGANPRVEYALDVRAKAASFDFPAYGRGVLDGKLQLTGGGEAPLLAGSVALRNAVVPVGAVYGSGSGSATGAARAPGLPIDPQLDIHAVVGKEVRITSGIVDVGVAGGVDVSGRLRAPRLAGTFTATDGTISSYNHIFRLVNATATFNPADGILPTIDARATSRVTNPDPDPSRNTAGSANIVVTVSGTPDSNNLQVTYSSDPPYSQEQIVGLLLDVPALLGAVKYDYNGTRGASTLRGAPGETNALLPPGVTPEQVSAISFNQEVFSLLNGQFTQRALNPIERVFEKIFGLSDLQFTVDYGGGLGYSLRRQLGKRNFSAFLSQTVTYPERSNLGFELEPKPFETLNFSYYQQNGVTSLITNATPGEIFTSPTRRLTSVQPLGNRSGFSINYNRRF